MPQAHRDTDSRNCGASTTVVGQSTVYCNGLLWAVDRDPNTHGKGNLKPITGDTVFCERKKVIVLPDTCYNCDRADHCPPSDDPAEASPDVYAYG
jgi:hypothetical protein